MKIRTDFVTNSSSSSFVAQLTVYTKDGNKYSLEGIDTDLSKSWDAEFTNGWFNEDIKDVLKCSTVSELALFMYSAVHGNGLITPSYAKNAYDNFEDGLISSAHEISDVVRVCFDRQYIARGEFSSCNLENDEELGRLADLFDKSKSEEDKKKIRKS